MPTRNHLVLQENHPRAFNNAGGAELRAVSGIVWITQTDAAEDVFLRAGESHRILHKGRLVVEAVRGEARIELFRPGWRHWVDLARRALLGATAIATPPRLAASLAPTVWIGVRRAAATRA